MVRGILRSHLNSHGHWHRHRENEVTILRRRMRVQRREGKRSVLVRNATDLWQLQEIQREGLSNRSLR